MAKKDAMDAMGQQVDSLYLSLGLNVADLEMGFQTAGQTVRQAMSRLNSEATQIRLKADIDVTRLEAAGKSVEALKAREKALNDELSVQQKKLELLNRAYEANAKTYGTEHSLTRGVDTKRLYQTRDIERLRAQIAQVNAELGKTEAKSTGAFSRISAGASRAQGAVKGLTSSIAAANAKIAGITAAAAGGYGLFSITDNAMKAGNNIYKLSQRLNTTTAEASKLSKVFQLSDSDINSVIPLFARLNKQVLSAGEGGNSLTRAMQEFGFTLTDSGGNLLSYEKQLEQLAKGYNKAVRSGQEAEFVANVLGARGAALIPLLQDYETNMEILSHVKTTGLLNPQEAHELYVQWRAMQIQAGQLTGAIGHALMPVAEDLMPEITQWFAEVTQLIRDNKDGIKEFGSTAGDVIGTLAKSISGLVITLGELKGAWNDLTGLAKDEDIIRANGGGKGLDIASGAGGIIGALAGGRFGGTKGAIAGGAIGSQLFEDAAILGAKLGAKTGLWGKDWSDYSADAERQKLLEEEKKQRESLKEQQEKAKNASTSTIKQEKDAVSIQKQLEKELANTTSKRLKEQLQAIKEKVAESIAEGKDEAAAWMEAEKDITKAVKEAMKEAQTANDELKKSIYSLTHSDLQNSLHGVDMAAKASLDRGADPELVGLEAALKKQKAIEQFEQETASYLDGIYEDSLTQRLNQIEREKKAWIQKGLDEVQATKAAEQQKRQAANDSIKEMFTSQKKYLDIYRKAMAGQVGDGGYLQDFKQSQQSRQQNAIRAIQNAMMRDAGVDPWESTSMAEVQGFMQAMKGANNWGLRMLRGGMPEGMGSDGAGIDVSALSGALEQSNGQITSLLGQINSGVPEINQNLSQILGAIQQGASSQVNNNITVQVDNVNADNTELVDAAAAKIADAVKAELSSAGNQYGYGR